ncbi:MAG: hypothetical protein IEMM0008_1471 [bacterium]|nr:MAG: hypothetical protein IEMM0008_1471 [bacterium]
MRPLFVFLLIGIFTLPQSISTRQDPSKGIEYDSITIPLVDGKYLTADRLIKGILNKLDLAIPKSTRLSKGKLDISGLKGYLLIKSFSLALGETAQVYTAKGRLIIRYKRQNIIELKRKINKKLFDLLLLIPNGSNYKPVSYGIKAINVHKIGRSPLLLIHGLDSSSESFKDLVKVLDHWNLYVFQYRNDQRIARSAQDLSKAIDQIPSKSVSICAKSMGNLVVREYLTDPKLYKKNVKKFLMIVPPNQGSRLAKLRIFLEVMEAFDMIHKKNLSLGVAMKRLIDDGLGEAGDDLSPGSLFLDRLNRKKIPKGITYAIIAGDRALISKWQHAALLTLIQRQTRLSRSSYGKFFWSNLHSDLEKATELIHGQGDMVVSLKSARLEGAKFFKVFHKNHLDILRGTDSSNPVFKTIKGFFK